MGGERERERETGDAQYNCSPPTDSASPDQQQALAKQLIQFI